MDLMIYTHIRYFTIGNIFTANNDEVKQEYEVGASNRYEREEREKSP